MPEAIPYYKPDLLPPQTGHGGEYLYTNGTSASWQSVPTPPSPTIPAYQTQVLITECTGANLSSSHGRWFFKTRYPMYANPDGHPDEFVKVYENGHELAFGDRWIFSNWYYGCIPTDLTDAVELLFEPTPSATYSIEYTENSIPFAPVMMKWIAKQTGVFNHSSILRKRLYNGSSGNCDVITSVNPSSMYDATITTTARTYDWHWSDTVGCEFWQKGEAMTMNLGSGTGKVKLQFRLEGYRLGARNHDNGASGGRLNSSMNSCKVPIATQTVNAMDIALLTGPSFNRQGIFYFRLRDIAHNVVSSFASERLQVRKTMLYDPTADNVISSRYTKIAFR